MKTYQNRQLGASEKIKDSYDKINLNSGEVSADLSDLYSQIETNNTDTNARIDAHVNGTAEKHGSDDILNESSVVGGSLSDAMETVQQQVNALVVSGTDNTTIGVYSLTAGGSANVYTGTFSGLTYFGGLKISATFNTPNTGASTINVNTLGAKSIKCVLPTGTKSDLKGGELYGKVLLEYDGTDFVVVEKNFLNGGTPSTPTTVTQAITSLPTSVIKSRADWKVEGNTLYQAVVDGDVSSSLTANGDSSLIDINTDGTIEFNAAYDATNQTFDIVSGNKYFLAAQASAGTFLNAVYLYYSDGTNQSAVGSGQSATPYGIITANKTLKANFKLSEGTFSGTLTKASMMVIPITTAYSAYTADQMNALVTMYFEGLKGVENVRVKSVGKNLFDKNKRILSKTLFANGTTLGDSTLTDTSNYIKVKSNTNYTVSNQSADGSRTIGIYDKNFNVITTYTQTGNKTFLTPLNGFYVRFSMSKAQVETAMLNEGSTALPYEPYTETETYLPVTLNRLPNQTVDSVDDDGVKVQRIDKDTDVSGTQYASIDLATYTNVDVVKTTAFLTAVAGTTAKDGSTIVLDKNGAPLQEVAQADIDQVGSVGKYYYHTDKSIWFIVANGAYADITAARTGLGTSQAYFQLATPITTQLPISNIIAEPSGTVYIDNMYSDVDFYTTNITVAGKTFSSIEKVLKIDKDTGFETDITSTCTLTGGKDGFTSTALVSGDLVWFALEATGTMIPSFTYSYAMDIKAATEGNTTAIKQTDSEVESLRRLFEQLEQRVQALEP